MRLRRSNLLLMFTSICFVLSANLMAQQLFEIQASDSIGNLGTPNQPASRPAMVQKLERSGKSLKQEELDEILSLRQSLGGGVMSVLGDMADGDTKQELQAEFKAELGRLMQGNSQAKPQLPAGVGKVGPRMPLPPINSAGAVSGMPPSPVQPGSLLPPVGQQQLLSVARLPGVNLEMRIDAMRRVSRQLEELAWELEEIDAYAEADQLRRQAQELRQKSRIIRERR